jgi:putative chitinase
MTAEEAADYVATPAGAIESACWFWNANKLNKIADTDDVKKMTKKINGGAIGLDDRLFRYNHAIKILGGDGVSVGAVEDDEDIMDVLDDIGVLRKGSRGEGVEAMQTALGIDPADGIFGRGTEKVLMEFQRENDLVPDGVAGPATFELMFN